MAEGVRRISGADIAISITGIAGPTGGSEFKPVGLTCFGLSTRTGTRSVKQQFMGERLFNREAAAYFALDLVRRELSSESKGTS